MRSAARHERNQRALLAHGAQFDYAPIGRPISRKAFRVSVGADFAFFPRPHAGRQLLRRPGYEIYIEKVLAACAEHGVAVVINANPWRLDLD